MPFFERLNFGNQLFLLLRCQRLVKLSQADHDEIDNFIHLRAVLGTCRQNRVPSSKGINFAET